MSVFIRSFITVFLLLAFVLLWYSTWRKGNAGRYDAAARLPLEDAADETSAGNPPPRPTV